MNASVDLVPTNAATHVVTEAEVNAAWEAYQHNMRLNMRDPKRAKDPAVQRICDATYQTFKTLFDAWVAQS